MKHSKLNILRYFWKHYRWQSIALLCIQFITSLLEGLGVAALLPLIEALISSNAAGDTPLHALVGQCFAIIGLEQTLQNTLILVAGLFIVKAIIRYFGMHYVAYLSSRTVMDFRNNLIRALLRTEWNFYIQKPVGVFVNALMLEAQRSGSALRSLVDILSALLQMITLTIIAGLASWQAIAVGLLAGIFLWLCLYRFITETGKASLEQKDTSKKINAEITDILQNYKPLKAMNIEERVFETIRNHIKKLAHISKRQIMAKQSMNIFHEPLFITLVCAGLYGSIAFLSIKTTILTVFVAIFYRFIGSWKILQQGYQVLTGQEQFFWSLQGFIQDAEEASEKTNQGLTSTLKDAIKLENIAFTYDAKPVLSGLNLTFPARKIIGIHGASGSGKTTIIDLICGLYEAQKGDIYIDDHNLRNIDIQSWRKKIGYVPQEFVIFNETIRYNISLGSPDISDDEIVSALKQVEAWDFIKDLPDKLNTSLGVAGGKLSGGQRQRISIARALVRKPSLLIMDEATASLDPKTELEIFKTLKKLAKTMTIIAISHQNIMKQQADIVIDLAEKTQKI